MRDKVAIAAGVQPGEQVITDGALYLSDGEKVSVATAATSSSAQIAGSQP